MIEYDKLRRRGLSSSSSFLGSLHGHSHHHSQAGGPVDKETAAIYNAYYYLMLPVALLLSFGSAATVLRRVCRNQPKGLFSKDIQQQQQQQQEQEGEEEEEKEEDIVRVNSQANCQFFDTLVSEETDHYHPTA